MKKQTLLLYLGICFLLTNTFSFSMEQLGAARIEPIVNEHEREKASKIIHTNSMCASIEAKNTIEAIIQDQPVAKCPGVLLHGPKGTGKTFMAKEMVGMAGGGIFLWPDVLEKNEGYLQRFIKEHIEDPVENGEQCVCVLDEVDRIVCYDTKYNDGIKPTTRILNLLKFAQKTNDRHGRQVVRVIATTNHPNRIPQNIRNLLLCLKIDYPDFNRRTIYFNELIDSLAQRRIDVSKCDKDFVDKIVNLTEKFPVRQLQRVKEEVEMNVYAQNDEQLSLKEEHFIETIEDMRNFSKLIKTPWTKKVYNWIQNDMRFYLFENDATYLVKRLFARALACSCIRRFLNIYQNMSSWSFFSNRANSPTV